MIVRGPVVFLLVFLAGCGVWRPGIAGSGISQSEFRNVGEFDQVDLSGFGTVNIHAGDRPTIRVTTDDNLLTHVNTYVENGKLKIKPRSLINPKSGLKVDVTVPNLVAARVSGAGDLNINDLGSEQLDLSVSGAGTINANGYVNNLSATISGAGEADLRELYAENVMIIVSGAGDASLNASESITARISGAGDIVCYGNPIHVDQHISGVGDFRIRTSEVPVEFTIGDARE